MNTSSFSLSLTICFFVRRVVEDVETVHRANIFSAKFLPCTDDRKVISCAGDGNILFTGKGNFELKFDNLILFFYRI